MSGISELIISYTKTPLFCFVLAVIPFTLFANEVERYRDLETLHAPFRMAELRAELEACVSEIVLVPSISIRMSEGGGTFEVPITNNSRFALLGVGVTITDARAAELGLEGQEMFMIDELQPGETLIFSEFEPGFADIFEEDAVLSARAVDVAQGDGIGVIETIFMTRWPFISSAEDVDRAFSYLCKFDA